MEKKHHFHVNLDLFVEIFFDEGSRMCSTSPSSWKKCLQKVEGHIYVFFITKGPPSSLEKDEKNFWAHFGCYDLTNAMMLALKIWYNTSFSS